MKKGRLRSKFGVQLLAFLLMALPPIPLYFAARQGADGWVWFLLALVVAGNSLAAAVR